MGPKRAHVEDELVARLTARLPRADLEALVVAHACSRAPLTRAELEARLPERLQSRNVKRVEVVTGASREGTGLFDLLDDELLVKILAHLRPIARVRAVTSVCKSWRRVRSCAELFADIEEEGSCKWLHRFSSGGLSVRQLSGLVGWLPSKGQEIRKAAVSASKDVNARTVPALLAKLKGLHELMLRGPKISGAALAAAANASGATLKALHIVDVKMTEATHLDHAAFVAAARQMPALEELTLPAEMLRVPRPIYLLSAPPLTAPPPNPIFSALSSARVGLAPRLRSLVVGAGTFEFDASACDWLSTAGLFLPSLEELRVEHASFASARDFEHLIGEGRAWAPLPRLRDLSLAAGTDYLNNGLLSTEQFRTLLGLAFGAAQSLETFHFDAGEQKVSARDRKLGREFLPQPSLAGALQMHPPPTSLRSLSLCHVDIAATDFDGVDLPRLTNLVLRGCGSHARQAAFTLAAQYPPGVLKSSGF